MKPTSKIKENNPRVAGVEQSEAAAMWIRGGALEVSTVASGV